MKRTGAKRWKAFGAAVVAALDRAADKLLAEPERFERLIAQTVESSREAPLKEAVSAVVRERVEAAVRRPRDGGRQTPAVHMGRAFMALRSALPSRP